MDGQLDERVNSKNTLFFMRWRELAEGGGKWVKIKDRQKTGDDEWSRANGGDDSNDAITFAAFVSRFLPPGGQAGGRMRLLCHL